MKPDAVRGERPDILGSQFVLQFPKSPWILERIIWGSACNHEQSAKGEDNDEQHAEVPGNLHAGV